MAISILRTDIYHQSGQLMSKSYWNSVMYPLQKHTGRKKTWQKFTHIFFVTHWGASVSRNPGPASSRTTPLKRQIRSCTPKQRNHFNWPGTHFIWKEMQKKGATCIHMYKDLNTIKACWKIPKFNDSMLQAILQRGISTENRSTIPQSCAPQKHDHDSVPYPMVSCHHHSQPRDQLHRTIIPIQLGWYCKTLGM
jgi:hypothetical protein